MRIILVSKAAGGKDFFRDYITHKESVDVSYTTRPKREGEEEGYTYNYLTPEEFKQMESDDAFFENVTFNGWKYGTSRNSWEYKKVFIMTPSGISQIPNHERKDCIVVYFDIEESVRRSRLKMRSDADKTERRLIADTKDFKEFCDFDIRVKNPAFNPEIVYNLIKAFGYADRS
jgi:guanylate kinase